MAQIIGSAILSRLLNSIDDSKSIVFDTNGSSTSTTCNIATANIVNRIYTIPDSGANSFFIMSNGTQTINGNKTFSNTVNLSALTASLPLQLDASKNIISAQINLTSGVTNTLPISNGGTNITTYTLGDILYASAVNVLSKLPIGASNQLLTVTSGIPSWEPVSSSLVVGTPSIVGDPNGVDITGNTLTLHCGGITEPGIGTIRTYLVDSIVVGESNFSNYDSIGVGFSNLVVGNNSFSVAGSVTTNSDNNVVFGNNIMINIDSSRNCTGIGHYALNQLIKGDNNTACGHSTGLNVVKGSNNSFYGYQAGYSCDVGDNNLILGALSNGSTNLYGSIVVGNNCISTTFANNEYIFGSNVTGSGSNTLTFSISNIPSAAQSDIINIDSTTGQIKRINILPIANGGTNISTCATGDTLYASAANVLSKLPIGTANQILTVFGGLPAWRSLSTLGVTTFSAGTTGFTPNVATSGVITLAGTLNAVNGGTGQTNYTIGDILFANTTTTLSRLADVAAGSYLRSGGVFTAPLWSTLTLPNSATTGDLLFASAANTISNLADVATGNALISGGIGIAPLWGKIGLTTHVSGILSIANGGTALSTIPTNGQLLIGNGTGYTLAGLTAGTGVTITPAAGAITISATSVPASPTTSIQFNNAGVFGGSANFIWNNTTNTADIVTGTLAQNRLRIGGTTDPSTSTVYIETNTTNNESQRVYFNSGSASTSAYITHAYDGNSPYLAVIDNDDDPSYITFNTTGTGTFSLPLYSSVFGSRGGVASRTLGANSGFAWYIGTGVTPASLISGTPVMSLDTGWLDLPNGTTANRPTPALGMIRQNTTTSRIEIYDTTTTVAQWTSLIGIIDKSTVAVTATLAAATTIFTYSVPGGTLLTDGILRLTAEGDWVNASGAARTCTVLVSYGGATMWTATTPSLANNTRTGWRINVNLASANSAAAQTLTGMMNFGPIGTPTTGTTGAFSATDFASANIYGTAAITSGAAATFLMTVAFSGATPGFTRRFYTLEKL